MYEVSADERARIQYEEEMLADLDERSRLSDAEEEGWSRGWKNGWSEGLNEGLDKGLNKGRSEGRNEGLHEGNNEKTKVYSCIRRNY